jgi:hypothetical protein
MHPALRTRPRLCGGRHGGLRAWLWAALAVAALLLAGCGGGGGGTDSPTVTPPPPTPPASGLVEAAQVAGRCVAPRAANALDENGVAYGDQAGTLGDEKAWVRSWIDETYLWYRDVRGLAAAVLDAASYASAVAYFDALKSPALTASGAARDRFHFSYNTPEWVAMSQSGIAYGYGFEVALLSSRVPREAVIAFTHPGTPASEAGITRGARVLAIDGVDLVNDSTATGVDLLNAGLFPEAPGSHVFTVLDPGAAAPRSVTLNAQALASTPVQNVRTLPAPHQHVGYLLFNDHIATAEPLLIDAVRQLKSAGVTELVLDLRYNGGGYLDIASELATMIAGTQRTAGRVFERLSFNDRNPFAQTLAQRTTPFHAVSQGFSGASGVALPTLDLGRVSVLTGPGTCSASEAIVNGLRGVGVQVDLIGGITCGKPYGFYPQDNCGTTYFAIQFEGVNDQGFGDYADGFAPTCAVADDFSHALGDPAEARLAAALSYRASGVCPQAASQATTRSQPQAAWVARSHDAGGPALVRPAPRDNRLYRGR